MVKVFLNIVLTESGLCCHTLKRTVKDFVTNFVEFL